ncbi:helix-turn-helix domain-containing protein [Cryobacterium zongtaii]|nr:helix-turn-helix domain-containing protein [Cryobacterium zongtaii]
MTSLDDVNSMEQAAAYLKVDEAKIRRLVYQQKIGCLKSGRALTFPRAALEAYVERYQTAALPANPHGLSDAGLRRVRQGRF